MIKSFEALERELTVAVGGKSAPILKEFTNTSGVDSFSVMPSHRYGKATKVDPSIAKEYIKTNNEKLAKIPYNTTSTTLYIRVK